MSRTDTAPPGVSSGFAPQRVLRFEVATPEILERIATEPLPLEMATDPTETEFFRDLYFDTDARDLERKGAAVRLRIHQDGHRTLMVDLRESSPQGRALLRRRAEAQVGDQEAGLAFRGDTEPARLLRALVEPDRLSPAFELETLRRLRPVQLPASDGDAPRPALLTCDAVTVRQGELTGEFHELEVRIPGSGEVPLDPLIDAFQESYRLRVTLADTAGRARELLETLEAGLLEADVRGAREVVVIPYTRGKIAVRRDGGRLRLPTGYGMGQEACRRMLKRYFGRTQGRLRILGTVAATTNRPALEVWLAENVRGPVSEEESELEWIALEEMLGLVGTARLRDPRTLAALHVLARSDLPGRLASVWADRTGSLSEGEPGLSPAELLESALPLDEELPEGISPSELPEQRLLNEDLSRLAFDERILVFAEDEEMPLLERVRFLSMFGDRQDDFFFSRIPRYKERLVDGDDWRTHDGLRPGEQLDVIGIRAREMIGRAYGLLEDLLTRLAEHDVHVLPWSRLEERERRYLRENYASHVEGVLTPMARDATHPFPHIDALRPAIAALVRPPGSGAEHFVAIELPDELPRFVPLPGGYRFVPLEEVVLATLPDLYPGLEVVRGHTFRITRSIDLRLEEDEEIEDVLQAVEEEIAMRPYRSVVRLEVDEEMPQEIRELILQELKYEREHTVSHLGEEDVYEAPWLVGLADLKEIGSLDVPGLHFPPYPRRQPMEDRPVLDSLREDDVFLHFPEDSFEDTVERFLEEAAHDPATLAIKLTVYRTNRRSRIVEALRQARANDKEAVAIVELKASLDEEVNIEWARSLERAGIHVIFSPLRYKVHAKVAMVARKEGGGVRRYAFIGTGNLNADTAASYVDLGLLTADPHLTEEVAAVFNILTGYAARTRCRKLLISPFNMRGRFLKMIRREAENAREGRPTGIRFQLNGLTDRRIIGALYEASEAGVPIRGTVRELCGLRPGADGFSETIRIRSLLGRFLQHARIFRFENGGEPAHFIGSADWRPRNLDRRIEIVTPVDHPGHKERLDEILETTFDDPEAWELGPDGTYRRDGTEVGGRPGGGARRGPGA